MHVMPATKAMCDKFVTQKHYSRRTPIFWAGFCLVIDGMVEGVAVYGQPSPSIQRHAFTNRDFRLYELSRLVIQTRQKNAASFLVANSLKSLPKPCAVVSYADSEWGHCGIIYQATNWKYTGSTKSHDHAYIVDGRRTHPMTLRDKGITDPKRWAAENGIQTAPPMLKHRYFIACGSKSQRAKIMRSLRYPIVPTYPKSDRTTYDDGPRIIMPYPEGKPTQAAFDL